MKKIGIIGTVGVPAKYGGFETLVENIIGDNCSADIQYIIYCSSLAYSGKKTNYKNAILKYIPLKANGIQSLVYDAWSILSALRNSDILLILGVSGSYILPIIRLFSKKRIVVNIDGLEHRRDKWNHITRKLLKYLEKCAIFNADVIIADNKGIQDYVKCEYGKSSSLIAYGGDHVLCDISHLESDVLRKYSLLKEEYAFSVCRIEPENNVHVTLEAYSICSEKIVFVGNWQNGEYGKMLKNRYGRFFNIILLDPIYDIPTLNVLRSSCKYYVHGHSAGGTNPSLVEAMFFNKPIFCFDVIYNRETTENKAYFYSDVNSLITLIENNSKCEYNGDLMREIADKNYCWKTIAKQYESLY